MTMAKKYIILPALSLICLLTSYAQDMMELFPVPEDSVTVQFSEEEQSFQLKALDATKRSLATQKADGDYLLTAFFSHDRNAHGSAEVGLRTSDGTTEYALGLNKIGEARVSRIKGKETIQLADGPKFGYSILQLERAGDRLLCRGAVAGEPLQMIAELEVSQGSHDVGLYLTAADSSIASAWNVRLEFPVADDYSPSQSGKP